MSILKWVVPALLLGQVAQAGQINGRVINTVGQPIPWIFLDVYDANGNYFDYSYTDETGDYTVPNLGAGTFYLRTYALGTFVDEWYDDVAGAAESLIHDPIGAGATPVEVPLLQPVTGIDFQLAAAATFTGRVTRAGSGNAPVTNIYVDAYLADGTRFLSGITEQNGTYAIAGLPAGSYAIRTDAGSRGVDTWQDGTLAFNSESPDEAGTPVLGMVAGQIRSGVDFSLDDPATLGGELRQGDGSAVGGVYVDLYDATGTHLEFTRSGLDGSYGLTGLPPGSYLLGTDSLGSYVDLWYDHRLVVTPGDPLGDGADAISLGATEIRTNVLFTLADGATLSGQVKDTAGNGIGDVIVDAFLEDIFIDFTVTTSDGAFTLSALPDGNYYLKVDSGGLYRNEWYPNQPVFDVDDPVSDGAGMIPVTDGLSVGNLIFELSPGAEVSGTVLAHAGGPIEDCYLDLYDTGGRRRFYTRSNSNGIYRLGGLPAGTYYLGTDSQDRFVDEWYPDQILITQTNPAVDGGQALVLTDATSLTNLHVELDPGGSISGRITGPTHSPLVNCYLDLYLGTNYFDWTCTDSNGVYQIDTLPAGDWYLRTDNAGELVNEWYADAYIYHRGRPDLDGATAVVLGPNQHVADIHLALGLGADLEGEVRTLAGSPLDGVFVDFYDFAGRHYDYAISDADGGYHLELVPPGTWYIGTDTFGAYLDRWFRNAPRDNYDDPLADGATPVQVDDGVVLIGVNLALGLPPDAQVIVSGMDSGIIEWQAESNQTYQVQRNLDLRDGNWVHAPSGALELECSLKPAGDAGLRQYRDPLPPPRGACYRITNQ